MERITFILTWIFQGASYLSAYGYGIMHRMHHAYTDTAQDPHSPSHDANLFAMMWKTKTIYQEINDEKVAVDARFTKNVPQWKSFDAFASSRFSRVLWISFYIAFFIVFATALIASKSPGLAAAKPASITLTPNFSSCFAILIFSSWVIDAPGLCSPSRNVVSNIINLFFIKYVNV